MAITLIMVGGSTFIVKYNKQSINSYTEGGTVVEEVISSIRNTTAFNTQDKLARQYDSHLQVAEKWGLKQNTALAFVLGFMMCIVYLHYGLVFWQGSRFLVSGDTSLSAILTVLLAVLIGGKLWHLLAVQSCSTKTNYLLQHSHLETLNKTLRHS